MSVALAPILALLLVATAQSATLSQFPPFEKQHLTGNSNLRVAPRADEATYRLPNNTEPVDYNVEITTNVHKGETAFTGKVIISLIVTEDTPEIVVHARQLEFIDVIIRKADATAETKLEYSRDLEREFYKLTAKDVIFEEGSSWVLTITYSGTLRSDNGGFYLSTYTDETGATKYLATTQFESTDARHAFPCYDEPAKRATFTITIKHDPSYNAISNMPVNAEASSSGVTTFETTVKMPTYLVAFIVSDFVYTEGEMNGLRQRVFSRKGTENEQEWALTTGMLVENRLSDYFGVPFALPKLDQAAIPDFAAGAMENWGMATYREEYLLYNPEKSTINTMTNVATILAHEDAHQWFGNLVAIEWWGYLWLKEGFATLFEHLAVDLAYPAWDIFQLFHVGSYQGALSVDANPSIRPMTNYVEKPEDIGRQYDSIAYAKAGSVLDMWRHALTNTVFQRGLTNYLKDKQYSAANETDLFDAIGLAAREENYEVPAKIEDMLVSWTRQGGVPVLNVERNYENGFFTVQQEQYTNDKSYQSSLLWYVPFNYAVQSNPDFRNTEATDYLLNEKQKLIEAKSNTDEWLILNKQSTGYYRINYDNRNWELIIDGLINHSHKIHARNRAQLISDSYNFATSGRLPHATLLQLMTYLPQENQYAPWATANTVVTLFNRYLSGDEDYSDFQFYVSELVSDQFDKFGVNDLAGEHHLVKFTRNVVINVACMAGLKSCLSETNTKLQSLVDNGTPLEPNLQTPIYCNGLKQAKDDVFNFVYDKMMNSNDQAERRLLISALGCAQNEKQLEKYVSSSIDHTNKLRTQERYTLLSPTYSRGTVGWNVCVDFLMNHWQEYGELNSGFGGVNPLYSDIVGMSAYVVNEDQKAKLQLLVDEVKNSLFVPDTIQVSVDSVIAANMEWLSTNRGPIISWVSTYRNGSPALGASALALALCLLVAKLF
ncbi:aminopeptidase N [Drosophila grimshawi]|uniref:Aminopeptidase n=1 Tax=Drosophila grimshawi TaxID=7222 RepID=B4JF64_DROGR|nr:aminopeptidase N [Drosophila grimshawi]EDV93345.1 GH19253 [Drosophila grimshawi]